MKQYNIDNNFILVSDLREGFSIISAKTNQQYDLASLVSCGGNTFYDILACLADTEIIYWTYGDSLFLDEFNEIIRGNTDLTQLRNVRNLLNAIKKYEGISISEGFNANYNAHSIMTWRNSL